MVKKCYVVTGTMYFDKRVAGNVGQGQAISYLPHISQLPEGGLLNREVK